MKKIIAFALVPGAALAHPGHPELAGAAGHDLAHLLIGGAIAVATVAALGLLDRVAARRRKE